MFCKKKSFWQIFTFTEEDEASSEKMAKTTDPDIYKLPPPEPLKVTEEGFEESVRIPKFEKEILTKDFEVKVMQLISHISYN